MVVEPERGRLLAVRVAVQRPVRGGPAWLASVLDRLRTYGVGAVLVEPNPSRLPGEVIQNCAIKITHQLVDEADRNAAAGSMLMTAAEGRGFATLAEGAAAFGGPARGTAPPLGAHTDAWRRELGVPA